MGWSFSYVDVGRKAHIESLTSASHFGPAYEPLAHRTVGNHVWQLVLHKETGRKFIHLDLIAKQRGGGWGEKSMPEDAGPYYYDCPLSLLDQAGPLPESRGIAREWREKVRAFHASKAKRFKPTAGQVVRYGGRDYRLLRPVGPRMGWACEEVESLMHYRIGAKLLAQAELVGGEMSCA